MTTFIGLSKNQLRVARQVVGTVSSWVIQKLPSGYTAKIIGPKTNGQRKVMKPFVDTSFDGLMKQLRNRKRQANMRDARLLRVEKRPPVTVRLRVRSNDYPAVDKCGLCGGEVERKAIEFPIKRDYDECFITIVLVDLPALICHGQCNGGEWVVRRVIRSAEGAVGRAFDAVLKQRDLSTAHLNTRATQLVT